MSTIRRRELQLDDPLTPSYPPSPHPRATEPMPQDASQDGRPGAGAPGPRPRQRGKAPGAPPAANSHGSQPPALHAPRGGESGVWRAWSGITGVGSFRLPHELLIELNDTARELGLPIGMIVTAAITQLLDQQPDAIAALVDRADDARIQGRRRSRRRLTTPSDD